MHSEGLFAGPHHAKVFASNPFDVGVGVQPGDQCRELIRVLAKMNNLRPSLKDSIVEAIGLNQSSDSAVHNEADQQQGGYECGSTYRPTKGAGTRSLQRIDVVGCQDMFNRSFRRDAVLFVHIVRLAPPPLALYTSQKRSWLDMAQVMPIIETFNGWHAINDPERGDAAEAGVDPPPRARRHVEGVSDEHLDDEVVSDDHRSAVG